MRSPFDPDRLITDWLDDLAPAHAPSDLLSQVLTETAGTRRRAGWRIPERWLPMSLFLRPHLVVRSAALVTALLASVVLAVAVALAAPSPAPSLVVDPGLPGNGRLAWNDGGRIVLADRDGSAPTVITGTDAWRHAPLWSPDGTHVAWTLEDHDAVEIADAAGTVLATIPGVSAGENAKAWSPDGRQLLLTRPGADRDRLAIVSLDAPEPRPIGDPDLWSYDPA